jgi:hypothetical protein
MKLLLDCDDVFDRLTRGPFPSGAPDDDAVESHLRTCHECRELAEALRPAVKLMHEAYADKDECDLPAYTGGVTPACPPSRPAVSPSLGWQLVAASLLGVAVGAFAFSGKLSQNDRHAAASPRDAASSGLAMLASLNLKEVCLPSSMALASTERLRCCTDCHSSTAAHRKHVDVTRLQLACAVCHEPQHE